MNPIYYYKKESIITVAQRAKEKASGKTKLMLVYISISISTSAMAGGGGGGAVAIGKSCVSFSVHNQQVGCSCCHHAELYYCKNTPSLFVIA